MTHTTTTQGVIEHLNPNDLIIETNIRTEASLDDAFLESIRILGVQTPILGYRDNNGGVLVRAGQRRTAAARKVELASVPVYVVDAPPEVAERIIEQLAENEHREALTEADRIEAWKQLEFEGMSATQIAKRTGAKRDRVKTGLGVAKAKSGTELVSQGVTLDQAAELLEFEDDPETLKELTECATENPDNFRHRLEYARRERASRIACAPIIEAEAAKGFEILTEYPSHGEAPYPIGHLTTEDGTEVTEEDLQNKEGISVWVQNYYNGPEATHYVNDPAQHGFTLNPAYSGGSQKGPMTDEQKAERKTLIANNKAWDAAEAVRREWLSNLITRKTLPKNTNTVVAAMLTHNSSLVGGTISQGNSLAQTLFGIESTEYQGLATYLDKHPTKAAHVILAVALAGVEATTGRSSWRYPDTNVARYLQALADWGYTLSPVERIAAKLNTEETASEN